MHTLGRIVCALGGLWLVPGAHGQEAEQGPELDFLEYLGAWAAEDDEWIAIEEWQKGNGTDEDADGDADEGRDAQPPEPQRNEDDEGE